MENLHDNLASVEFYDARYEKGYMEEWDEGKKMKVREIICALNLPSVGKALDFGCGNGVFTNIIKECLPNWDVFGVEISKTAVSNAKRKFPNCNFFLADESVKWQNEFDFLFSHHVIEHVPNLDDTFKTINAYLKPYSSQLHILPCGNEGSFEYRICQLKKNGIEKDRDNRFFFEEPGHLRRLTSKEFEQYENRIGFNLSAEFYANQNDGAVNWITKSSPRFVKKLTDANDAISEQARQELNTIRKKLLPLTYKQFAYVKYNNLKNKWIKSASDKIKLAVLFLPAKFSKKLYNKLETASNMEWASKKLQKNGSEMFLFFKR